MENGFVRLWARKEVCKKLSLNIMGSGSFGSLDCGAVNSAIVSVKDLADIELIIYKDSAFTDVLSKLGFKVRHNIDVNDVLVEDKYYIVVEDVASNVPDEKYHNFLRMTTFMVRCGNVLLLRNNDLFDLIAGITVEESMNHIEVRKIGDSEIWPPVKYDTCEELLKELQDGVLNSGHKVSLKSFVGLGYSGNLDGGMRKLMTLDEFWDAANRKQ